MKYEINNIYNEDCLQAMNQMPDNYFELAIVDPPYGIGDFRQGKSRKKHSKINWNGTIPTKEYFTELKRVSKNRIVWGINYYTDYIKDVGRLVHDKTGGGRKNQLPEMSDADIASHSFGVNIKIFNYVWQGNAQGSIINWANEGINSRCHPCQKPVDLYKWILKTRAKEGDKILDTHLGSASSIIACIDMGFDFMGFELDEDYYNAAKKRVTNHLNQGDLTRDLKFSTVVL
jgi:site-specific DNA-methyltransferase (adenine-specific)